MKKLYIVIFLLAPLFVFGQATKTITGQILDKTTNQPIIGATIFIDSKETSAKDYNPQGTASDIDGRFSLTIPTTVKFLNIHFLGYEMINLDTSTKRDFTVRLAEASNAVEGVVVTGYQKIEKRKLTSSIVSVNMDEIDRIGVASVDQMLEGQLAGVQSSSIGGGPGSGSKVRIRTSTTLNGNDDPLWVLDGMPLEGNEIPKDWNDKENIDNLRSMSIAGINPEDIAEITVLKDAAATAIYGARAANGVIIVTTKKGVRNQAMRVNVSAAAFVTERPDMSKLNLMNSDEKVDFELMLAKNPDLRHHQSLGGVARILDANGGADRENLINGRPISSSARDAINKLRASGANWGDEIYRMTLNQQYSVSIAGGGEKSAYYFSTGYFDEQGTTKGTDFNRINLTLKTDFDLLKNLKFGVGMFGVATNNNSYVTNDDAFTNPSNYSRRVNPYLDVYNADGSYMYDPDMVAYQRNNSETLPFNFVEESVNTKYELKNKSFKSIFDLEYKPVSNLRIYSQFGMQIESIETEKFMDEQTYYMRKFQKDKDSHVLDLPDGGAIKNDNRSTFSYNWKTQAEYNARIGDIHEFDIMAGMELRSFTNKQISTQGFGYDPTTLTTRPVIFADTPEGITLAQSTKYRQYTHSFYENRFASYFATASYTYDNRFTAFGSFRYDGTNLFGVDPKYKFTPLWSASGSWNINREEWMKNVEWLSNLKLRASYGVQGNIDRNTSPYVTGVWGNTNIDGVYEPIITATLPNRYLSWETTHTWNAAIDMGVLDNKLSMTFEVYSRISDNLISPEFIAHENGFNVTSSNFGKMTSSGLELSIYSVNIDTKSFRWSTNFNISTYETLVNRINSETDIFSPSRQGYSANAIFGFKTAGLDENGLPLMVAKSGQVMSMKELFQAYTEDIPGAGKYIHFNQSPEHFRDSQEYLGSTDPKFTGGLINKFNYKNFDLSISMNFSVGQTVRETPFYQPTMTGPGHNTNREVLDIWSPSNKNSQYPALLPAGDSPFYVQEPTDAEYAAAIFEIYPQIFDKLDIWTKKLSYLRINSIRLGYSIPSRLTKKAGMSSVKLSFEARNPFVISTNYDGYFDPETYAYGSLYSQPISRTFSLGANITF